MHVLRPRRARREQPQQSAGRVRAWWSRAARRGVAGVLAAAMVAALAPAPVSAGGGDGEAAEEDGAPRSAGGHGPANAPRSGGGGSEGPPDLDFSDIRGSFTEGICAVGDTMWVGIRSWSKLRAHDLSTGQRDEDSDLPIENPARGVWCDGETLWYTTKNDHSKIFAYDLATGTRQEDREFDISALDFSSGGAPTYRFWSGPLGIASDGDTMWVATNSRVVGNRLYALDMATKEPKPGSDIALGSFYPRGLFSDGEFLWVATTRGNTVVRVYDISTLARVESLVVESPGGKWGLWSDGYHMWVANFAHTTVRAYPMPEAYGSGLETLEVSGVELVSPSPREFRGRVARGTASVTVTAVAAGDEDTVTFGTVDADGGTEGHQWSLELGDNTLEITVSDGTLSRTSTITVVKVDVDALSNDATLSSLSVDGAGVDDFAPDVHDYGLRVAHDAATATVAATSAEAAAEVAITPADADPDAEGHQVSLDVGANPVTVAVVATDGFAEAVYRLTISRPRRRPPPTPTDYSGGGLEGPPGFVVPGFREGICAVGDTLWVSSRSYSKLYAYDRSTGERDEDGDLLSLENPARGVWCDDETVWYTSKRDHSKIFAYDLATGLRDEDREFDISALNFSHRSGGARYYWAGPLGIASDGDTMWVATNSRVVGNRLYALDMATKEPKPGSDIALGGFYPKGLFTDGEFLWVASTQGNAVVRAYDIATRTRVESLDISSDGPWGLWSDGEHMWLCNFHRERVRAYPMPDAYRPGLETPEVSGVELVRSSSREFRGNVARGTASVTVTAAPFDDTDTVAFGTADADDGTEGHQWSLALGDNTLEITVSDGTHSRTYTITVVKVDVDALSDDATLSSLSVDGAGVDGFAPDVGGYRVRVAHDAATATVAATATEAAARVAITPADADPDAEGHQVALAEGPNPVTVAVVGHRRAGRGRLHAGDLPHAFGVRLRRVHGRLGAGASPLDGHLGRRADALGEL